MKHENMVAMTRCYFCGDGKDILIHQRLGDISKLHNKVVDRNPCPKCADLQKQGVMLIVVRDGETGDNPYRTGEIHVVRDEAIHRWFASPEKASLRDAVLKSRCTFIHESTARSIGLPKPKEDAS